MPEQRSGGRIRLPLETSPPRVLSQAGYRVHSTRAARTTLALYDTSDRRLAAAGGELSLHRRDGWLWRRDPLGHPKLVAREWTAPALSPEQQVLDWTRAYRRGRAIGARATVTVHRRTHRVSDQRAQPVLTLIEERVDEHVGAGARPRLRHVRVTEAGTGAAAAIAVLRDRSVTDGAALALLRPALVRPPRLHLPAAERTGARDLFLRSTVLAAIQWLYFDCEVSVGAADALRKLRVALRRLRSDLQTFSPLLDRTWAGDLRDQLGDLGARLGVVRDAEVLSERLDGLVAMLPASERAGAVPLLNVASSQLAAERAQLDAALASDGYVETLHTTLTSVTRPRWLQGAAEPHVARLARRPWRRLRAYVDAIQRHPDDAELHRIRILAKRARYAADACVPAVGEPAERSATNLAALQTVLGIHHDAVVTRQWLQHQSAAITGVSFPAGELAALELRRAEETEVSWRDAWSRASRPQDWRWLRS